MEGGMADEYIVIGAGVFGASTALELARAGKRVTVLERSADGYCAPDAASSDLNKIIRSDYTDAHYRDLGKKAMSIWRRSDLLSPYYHETGVFLHVGPTVAPETSKEYVKEHLRGAAENTHLEIPYSNHALRPQAHPVTSKAQVQSCFPTPIQKRLGGFADDIEKGTNQAYFNPRGGWAEARRATCAVLDEAKRLGVSVISKAQVSQLLFEDAQDRDRVTGVGCSNGQTYHVKGKGQVVVCAGAWAEGLMRSLLGPSRYAFPKMPTWASPQCVVTLQLNEEQHKAFSGSPVVLEFSSGLYLFEPDENGVMKFALFSSGCRYPLPSTDSSSPPAAFPIFPSPEGREAERRGDNPQDAVMGRGTIPDDQTQRMLQQLYYIYPELASAPVIYSRVCFYSDSLDENWIIDYVPSVKGLLLASGDSGHAFKFLPVLGNLICARLGIEQAGTLTSHQKRVFSFAYHADMYRRNTGINRHTSDFKGRL